MHNFSKTFFFLYNSFQFPYLSLYQAKFGPRNDLMHFWLILFIGSDILVCQFQGVRPKTYQKPPANNVLVYADSCCQKQPNKYLVLIITGHVSRKDFLLLWSRVYPRKGLKASRHQKNLKSVMNSALVFKR